MIAQPYVLIAVAAVAFVAGMWVADTAADVEMYAFKEDLRKQQDDQRDLTMRAEAADRTNTAESTKRVDQQEAQRIVEIRYVDREVIKYRDRPADRGFTVTAEFLRLYNESAGLSDRVPEAGAARPPTDGSPR